MVHCLNTLFRLQRFEDFGREYPHLVLAGVAPCVMRELGRSFVQPRYQNRQSLDYLWQGIGAFLRRYPRFRYLFGPASISRLYGDEAIQRIASYYARHYQAVPLDARPRNPLPLPEAGGDVRPVRNRECDLADLKAWLADRGPAQPTLFKHYAQVVESDGIRVGPFNIDPTFGDCVDGLVVVDLNRLRPGKRKRYLESRPVRESSPKPGS